MNRASLCNWRQSKEETLNSYLFIYKVICLLTGSWLPQFWVHLSVWAPNMLLCALAEYLSPGGTITPGTVVWGMQGFRVCRICNSTQQLGSWCASQPIEHTWGMLWSTLERINPFNKPKFIYVLSIGSLVLKYWTLVWRGKCVKFKMKGFMCSRLDCTLRHRVSKSRKKSFWLAVAGVLNFS